MMSNVINNVDEIKLIFLLEVYPKIKQGKVVPNINFIFNNDTLNSFVELKQYIKNDKYLDKLNTSINLLKQEKESISNSDNMAIDIKDANLFFSYLMEISNAMYYQEVSYYGSASNEISDIMLYIWLRMSPNDFNDVIKFLELQLSFIYNDNVINKESKNWINIGIYDRYQVTMIKYLNELYYESNTSICMRLEDNNNFYVLPSILYGITNEQDEYICYIYGLQNNDRLIRNNDKKISDELKKLNKGKNNHGTYISFIIALEKFTLMLSEIGITTIKLPLLQVLNYQFHELLSNKEKENLLKNFPNYIELEELLEKGISNEETKKYENYKQVWYLNAVDKEDDISKRKTEGLINMFRRLEEQKGIIKIKTIPFINDENLIIEILPSKEKYKKY